MFGLPKVLIYSKLIYLEMSSNSKTTNTLSTSFSSSFWWLVSPTTYFNFFYKSSGILGGDQLNYNERLNFAVFTLNTIRRKIIS